MPFDPAAPALQQLRIIFIVIIASCKQASSLRSTDNA